MELPSFSSFFQYDFRGYKRTQFVSNTVRVHDIAETELERSYHLFVLGLLASLGGQYQNNLRSRKRVWSLLRNAPNTY